MKADRVSEATPVSASALPARRGEAPTERAPQMVNEVLGSPGQPLDSDIRSAMERRFNFDFGSVRVHRDDRAAESAGAVGSHAYAVGNHVVFGPGRYRPGTPDGRWLIAHELAHVRQQRDLSLDALRLSRRLAIGHSDAPAECAADRMADAVTRGDSPRHEHVPVSVPTVQRLGEGHAFLRWFGIESGDFSVSDLVGYLSKIAKRRKPETGFLDDDMAREIVARGGVGGEDGYRLTDASFHGVSSTDIKRILIQEMLSGPTTGPDEQAIVTLLARSSGPQIQEILDPQMGLSIQDIESDLSEETTASLYRTIDAKLPQLRKENLTRGKGTATKDGSCTAGRAVRIDFAHRRAIVQVDRVLRLLDQFSTKPGENKNVDRVLGIYFGGAKRAHVATIQRNFAEIRATIPRLLYQCPAEPFTSFRVTDSEGKVTVHKAEPGLEAKALSQVTGDDMKVLLFPEYFDAEPQRQALAVVHEAFHHAKRQGDIKEFYGEECEGLPLATALTNADSYAQTARALAQEGLQITIEDCPPHVQTMILTAARRAELMTALALSSLSGIITDPRVRSQLVRHFKVDPDVEADAAQIVRIRGIYAEIQAGFGEKIDVVCEEETSEDDTSVRVAKTGGIISPRGGTIHLYPGWVASDPELQAHIILHEMGHRAAGLGWSNDIYRKLNPRAYSAATAEQAVENADAYASFAHSLAADKTNEEAATAKDKEKAKAKADDTPKP